MQWRNLIPRHIVELMRPGLRDTGCFNWAARLREFHDSYEREGARMTQPFDQMVILPRSGQNAAAYCYIRVSRSHLYIMAPHFLESPVPCVLKSTCFQWLCEGDADENKLQKQGTRLSQKNVWGCMLPTLLQRLMLHKMTALILHIVGNANSDTLFLKVISPLFLLSTRFPPKLALPFLSSLERPTRPTPDGRPRRIVSRRRDGRRRASTWRPLGLTL